MSEKIKDLDHAHKSFDEIMGRMHTEVNAMVAKDFKETLKLWPDGVSEADLRLMIFKALRNWIPKA